MKKYLLALIVILLLVVSWFGWKFTRTVSVPADTTVNREDNFPPTTPLASFNKTKYSIDMPDSLWVIVNKQRPLPSDYIPAGLINYPLGSQLRPETAKALDSLLDSAKKEGISFKIISGYRSYGVQASTYNSYVKSDGQANADTYSARPGHSEHQTGLAVDLGNSSGNCDLEACFGDTAAGKWLAAHGPEYGFIIRYQKDKQLIVGYQYEPWHLRYVGNELAAELTKTGQTMEEFFGLPAAPNY